MGGIPAHRLACCDCYAMKTERMQLRAFVLFLFLVVSLSLASASFAAVTTTPTVAGYARDSVSGGYLNNRAGQGQALFDSASKSYGSTGSFNVGGKSMSVPNKIPLVAGAADLAKKGMRLNPYALAGSLALPWLIDQGMEWMEEQKEWQKFQAPEGEYPLGKKWKTDWCGVCGSSSTGCDIESALRDHIACVYPTSTFVGYELISSSPTNRFYKITRKASTGTNYLVDSTLRITNTPAPTGEMVPATDTDWDGLPDPIPTVGGELPTAGYMPKGAPVNAPTYDFAPYSAPTGEPYKKPDGSTVQPMVTVSPNITNITYNTYNQTTHNAAGEPVVDAPPSDENADEVKDPCDSNPDRAGCVDLGTPTDDQVIPRVEVPLTFEPVAIQQDATCPAPMTVSAFGKSIPISYDGACTYASGLKPIVIAVAYLSALLIIFGVPRATNG